MCRVQNVMENFSGEHLVVELFGGVKTILNVTLYQNLSLQTDAVPKRDVTAFWQDVHIVTKRFMNVLHVRQEHLMKSRD